MTRKLWIVLSLAFLFAGMCTGLGTLEGTDWVWGNLSCGMVGDTGMNQMMTPDTMAAQMKSDIEGVGYTNVAVSNYVMTYRLEGGVNTQSERVTVTADGTVAPWGAVSGYLVTSEGMTAAGGNVYTSEGEQNYTILDNSHVYMWEENSTYYYEVLLNMMHLTMTSWDSDMGVTIWMDYEFHS